MDNKIYTKKELLHEGINAKAKAKVFTLFFEIKHLKFGVRYQPSYFSSLSGLAHFDFYAMSRGFEKFTETGYRSLWVQNPQKTASYAEVKAYFIEAFKAFLDLEKPSKPMQLGLF